MKKITKNKLNYSCYKCGERFVSWQKRDKHAEEYHKPPKKTEIGFKFVEPRKLQDHNRELSLGSNVRIIIRGTIIKITKTDGSDSIEADLGIKENTWVIDTPQSGLENK